MNKWHHWLTYYFQVDCDFIIFILELYKMAMFALGYIIINFLTSWQFSLFILFCEAFNMDIIQHMKSIIAFSS